MICPKCGSKDVSTSDTRDAAVGVVRRRRTCIGCGYAWYTVECGEFELFTSSAATDIAKKLRETSAALETMGDAAHADATRFWGLANGLENKIKEVKRHD